MEQGAVPRGGSQQQPGPCTHPAASCSQGWWHQITSVDPFTPPATPQWESPQLLLQEQRKRFILLLLTLLPRSPSEADGHQGGADEGHSHGGSDQTTAARAEQEHMGKKAEQCPQGTELAEAGNGDSLFPVSYRTGASQAVQGFCLFPPEAWQEETLSLKM